MAKAAKALKAKHYERKTAELWSAAWYTIHTVKGVQYTADTTKPLESGCMCAWLEDCGEEWRCLGIGHIAGNTFPNIEHFTVKFDQWSMPSGPQKMRFDTKPLRADRTYGDARCIVARVIRITRDI